MHLPRIRESILESAFLIYSSITLIVSSTENEMFQLNLTGFLFKFFLKFYFASDSLLLRVLVTSQISPQIRGPLTIITCYSIQFNKALEFAIQLENIQYLHIKFK